MTWATPKEWFTYLNLEFGFTLDPCCQHETAKCEKHYTPAENGLAQSWADERVFMNPPYGREIGVWMKKAYTESRVNNALVVCFVPARVDTNWWHDYAIKGEVRFPKGRVKFEGATASAPFPIAIVIFRPRAHLTPPAPDAWDSAPLQAVSKPIVLSTSQTLSTPTKRG